jgi:alpha-L-rhamnosidase
MSFKPVSLTCEALNNPVGLDCPLPKLGWRTAPGAPFTQTAFHIQAASSAAKLAKKPDLWDSGKTESGRSFAVEWGGKKLKSKQCAHWRVMLWGADGSVSDWSETAVFETGPLKDSDWDAKWIGLGPALGSWYSKVLPAPCFRREFVCERVENARLYICGLGYHKLFINGRRVGDGELEPVVTHYDRRARYITHDVTGYLIPGKNTAAVALGNGWYNSHTAEVWHFDKASWRDYPKLLLQLDIGGKTALVSDESWKVTDKGPVVFDGLRNGEFYDARLEMSGWTETGFDDSAWVGAVRVPGPGGALSAQFMPPCKIMETFDCARLTDARSGGVIYDAGTNITGWTRLTVSGEPGAELTLAHSEKLAEDGTDIDQSNINSFIKSGETQTDKYTLKGAGSETWEPCFTYHGFRYIRIKSSSEKVKLEKISGRAVNTAFRRIGEFECSDETLNSLDKLTLRSYLGNFTGIPTDCPHREKNGWTGDAQLAAETGLFSFDAANAYRQWLENFPDTQRPSGQLPGIVPSCGWGFNWGSGPAWDNAMILIPWYIYLYTGDSSAIHSLYPAMKKYMDYCASMSTGNLISFGLGDWCHLDNSRIIPVEITSSAYYLTDCRVMARFAKMTGDKSGVKHYQDLGEKIRASLNAKYYKGGGLFGGGEQTALGCALYQGIVDDGEKAAVARKLAETVERNGFKVDFGILGAKYVPRALSDNGYAETAYK